MPGDKSKHNYKSHSGSRHHQQEQPSFAFPFPLGQGPVAPDASSNQRRISSWLRTASTSQDPDAVDAALLRDYDRANRAQAAENASRGGAREPPVWLDPTRDPFARPPPANAFFGGPRPAPMEPPAGGSSFGLGRSATGSGAGSGRYDALPSAPSSRSRTGATAGARPNPLVSLPGGGGGGLRRSQMGGTATPSAAAQRLQQTLREIEEKTR